MQFKVNDCYIHALEDTLTLINGEELNYATRRRKELFAYSPEMDTELKIICFPTFPGHCGCMLFPLDEIHCAQKQDELSQMTKNTIIQEAAVQTAAFSK